MARSDSNTYTLAQNVSATGSPVAIRGGEYLFCVEGTDGGATISLQIQMPSGTWTKINVFSNSRVSFTSLPNSQTAIDLPPGNVRLLLEGGSPTGITAHLIGLG